MPVKFKKTLISSEAFESAAVFDVDDDGILDIVSGGYWYKGPDFFHRFRIGDVKRVGEYYDDFSTIALDINGDGRLDFVTGGWFGETLRWMENPHDKYVDWPEHTIAVTGSIETTRAWDIDGDGELEIVPNTPGHPLIAYKLIRGTDGKGTGRFSQHVIYNRAHGHGLGFGDIDGDGRGEIILVNGWLKAPDDPLSAEWTLHQEFQLNPLSSVPILVEDIDGDGVNELIVGAAHGYGLDWYKQEKLVDGSRTWTKHPIDPFNAQYHDLIWADLDGDGQAELVTGKRHRAHNGNEDGEADDLGIYYFKWNGESFTKQVVAYGPQGDGAGVGIHFFLADLHGTGRLDIIAPGKDGLHVFYNQGP